MHISKLSLKLELHGSEKTIVLSWMKAKNEAISHFWDWTNYQTLMQWSHTKNETIFLKSKLRYNFASPNYWFCNFHLHPNQRHNKTETNVLKCFSGKSNLDFFLFRKFLPLIIGMKLLHESIWVKRGEEASKDLISISA